MLLYDNFMRGNRVLEGASPRRRRVDAATPRRPHRSANNTSPRRRRNLFGIFYDPDQVPGRDLREEYYASEARGRRADGSKIDSGRANLFHLGEPVISAAGSLGKEL